MSTLHLHDERLAHILDEGENAGNARRLHIHAGQHSGRTIDELFSAVERVASRPLPKLLEVPCPQEDCLRHHHLARVYKCQDCDFLGCSECYDAHRAEGH